MKHFLIRTLILAPLCAASFALTGCGNSDDAPTPGPKKGSRFLHRNDVKSHTVHVPGLKSAACFTIIESTFRFIDGDREMDDPHRGYYDVSVDMEQKHVTVTFNSLVTSSRNVEHMIADAGFAVRSLAPLAPVDGAPGGQTAPYEIPANQAAYDALPKECR